MNQYRTTYGVEPLLAAIGEPVSTYYQRAQFAISDRMWSDAALCDRIWTIWDRSRRSYGCPRVHAVLTRHGVRVGRKRVERLMRELGIQGAHLRRHWRTTRSGPARQRRS